MFYREFIRVVGKERIRVAEQDRDVWRIIRTSTDAGGMSRGFSGEITSWIDIEMGVTVRQEITAGTWDASLSYEALEINIPR
jgi:hypothetical protein